jgi:hypothetical protein
MVEAGADLASVSTFLGHRTPATTRAFYARFATPRNSYSSPSEELRDEVPEVRKVGGVVGSLEHRCLAAKEPKVVHTAGDCIRPTGAPGSRPAADVEAGRWLIGAPLDAGPFRTCHGAGCDCPGPVRSERKLLGHR